MAETHSATNHACREWTKRTRALKRQLDRTEQLIQLHPDDAELVKVRDLLADVIQGHERGELSSPQAESVSMLAHHALKFAELEHEREAMRARGIEIEPVSFGGGR
jgi:hypothetical protein